MLKWILVAVAVLLFVSGLLVGFGYLNGGPHTGASAAQAWGPSYLSSALLFFGAISLLGAFVPQVFSHWLGNLAIGIAGLAFIVYLGFLL